MSYSLKRIIPGAFKKENLRIYENQEINSVILIGRITSNIMVSITENSEKIYFSLLTVDNIATKSNSYFHKIVVFKQPLKDYLINVEVNKGDKLYVKGEIRHNIGYKSSIIAKDLNLIQRSKYNYQMMLKKVTHTY